MVTVLAVVMMVTTKKTMTAAATAMMMTMTTIHATVESSYIAPKTSNLISQNELHKPVRDHERNMYTKYSSTSIKIC